MHTALSADAEVAVVGGKWSGSFRCGWLQALDPGLALHAHVTDKSYVNLAKQKSWSFNILTRVGARASHGSKIKD